MADDLENIDLMNTIYEKSIKSQHSIDLIIPSRFMQGGKMINCPFPKNILVKGGNKILSYFCHSVTDATNAFKFFKTSSVRKITFKSQKGFTYALEATIKLQIGKYKILEVPSVWIERSQGKSNFKIVKWLPYYFYWLTYLFFMKIIK